LRLERFEPNFRQKLFICDGRFGLGRYEIISGVDRYRRRSYEEKALILREASVPGAVISHVARQHDIRPQQIYQWRRQLLAPELPVFVPVTLNPVLPGVAVPGGPASVPVEVCLRNGRSIKFRLTSTATCCGR
jgi:hypothetical protein